MAATPEREKLFEEICSKDFLEFEFNSRSYREQLYESTQKSKQLCAVTVTLRKLGNVQVVWCEHNFAFMGGSLGCAEGERLTLAFEKATELGVPIIIKTRTGGARMQEGTMSLMQMAKVSVAVEAHRRQRLPFISVLVDPTYGGVPASYAMQSDVKISVKSARIGFAGPEVILNTMFDRNQANYDAECPAEFQSAEYVKAHGQIDIVVEEDSEIEGLVTKLVDTLARTRSPSAPPTAPATYTPATQEEIDAPADYTRSRKIDRPQAADVINTLFTSYVELSGDGHVATDKCIRGGVALYGEMPIVVIACHKGHTPGDMQAANYGMPAPAGYRTALRLFKLAETFGFPVITLVDTCGAWPSFDAERDGQSEAIATNLTVQASLRVPIITLVLGEGGSGGALGIAMGNAVGMLSQGYYGVISPEGAASILGRYRDDEHKAVQFPVDCNKLATAQQIYAYQLHKIGVVDEIIYERIDETFTAFPVTSARIGNFLTESMTKLCALSADEIVSQRYQRFRKLGTFETLDADARAARLAEAESATPSPKAPRGDKKVAACPLAKFLANQVMKAPYSRYKGKTPAGVPLEPPAPPVLPPVAADEASLETAKHVLDRDGPEGLAAWVLARKEVLITDTTMRDAHQSLLATRCRTEDLTNSAKIAGVLLRRAFSFECWGGATFDVAYRFLNEDPWDRLREIRAAAPNTLTQMLIRGANAVGYTSYPDNVVERFVELAADAGLDVFRIFDCFNDVKQMQVAINAVRKVKKVAEVCICYTSDVTTSEIYNLEYYKNLARDCAAAGAHMIGIKDMAGLLKPQSAAAVLKAIREGCDLPVHYHTHATSSASLATTLEMAHAGCDIIDFAVASMADTTSQPSLNAFCAAMAGDPRDPMIDFMKLEPLDLYWMALRDMYVPFENGLKAGSARVFDHEIPGGQYANLLVQCKDMGLYEKWGEVLDMYRDVNALFGDIVKVTPSSKCVGDLALYLITRGIAAKDVTDPIKGAEIDYPESVIELMEGRLGFPHRGFPAAVVKAILKDKPQIVGSPSAALGPADFEKTKENLIKEWGADRITDEDISASLLYPKVYSDFMKHQKANSRLLRHLPTPIFFYGFALGQTIVMKVPAALATAELQTDVPAGASTVDVTVTLTRVGPLKKKAMRTVVFTIDGQEHHVEVPDTEGSSVFEGEMANASVRSHVAAPMPGAVEAMGAAEGASVAEGDVLCVVSAMKMEIKVKAPHAGKVVRVVATVGTKVIEGALLFVVEPSA